MRVCFAPVSTPIATEPQLARREIDRTPGRLVVAALICLYGGFLLVVIGIALEELVSHGLGKAVMALGGLAFFAIKLLLLAAIFASFDKKPSAKDPG